MAQYKPGERDIIEKNGHLIYLDDRWEALRDMLAADKDRIMAALKAKDERQGKQTEEK